MKTLTSGMQMRCFDQYTINTIGIPSMVLMEQAANAVTEELVKAYRNCSCVLAVCGSGNNGGDGFAIARLLLMRGYRAEVFLVGNPAHMTEQCRDQQQIFLNLGGTVHTKAMPDLRQYDVLVDALFGVGLSRPVEGIYSKVIQAMNDSGIPAVAVDLPSGISADDGRVLQTAVRADMTVTFSFLKRGHLLYPGREYAGNVVLRDVGIVRIPDEDTGFYCAEKEDIRRFLPSRLRRSNKGTYGKAVLAAGNKGMAGAAVLGALAASRSGCGLVQTVSHDLNRVILQSRVPEAIFTGWDDFADEAVRERCLRTAGSIGVGPGLGTDDAGLALLQNILRERGDLPLVLDADALNLLSRGDLLNREGKCLENCVITPHPGEMARLCGCTVKDVLSDPVSIASSFASERKLTVVLKDASTVITDGSAVWLNSTGCSGLSCGGSGDVLTGLLTGLLAQKMPVMQAAVTAVYLHGLAGEIASSEKGVRGMTAADLPDALAQALLFIMEGEKI